MELQELSVGMIVFLDDGKLSVEVGANSKAKPLSPPAVDNIRIRVEVAPAAGEALDAICAAALRTARAILKD